MKNMSKQNGQKKGENQEEGNGQEARARDDNLRYVLKWCVNRE